jgi:hypothetical protein
MISVYNSLEGIIYKLEQKAWHNSCQNVKDKERKICVLGWLIDEIFCEIVVKHEKDHGILQEKIYNEDD